MKQIQENWKISSFFLIFERESVKNEEVKKITS